MIRNAIFESLLYALKKHPSTVAFILSFVLATAIIFRIAPPIVTTLDYVLAFFLAAVLNFITFLPTLFFIGLVYRRLGWLD